MPIGDASIQDLMLGMHQQDTGLDNPYYGSYKLLQVKLYPVGAGIPTTTTPKTTGVLGSQAGKSEKATKVNR